MDRIEHKLSEVQELVTPLAHLAGPPAAPHEMRWWP